MRKKTTSILLAGFLMMLTSALASYWKEPAKSPMIFPSPNDQQQLSWQESPFGIFAIGNDDCENDTEDPTAGNPEPVNVQCSGDVPDPDISVVKNVADNCTTNPTVAFVSDSNDGNTNPETITRTYSVTDQAGNQITVNQKITINDTTKPTASNPEPINVQCSGDVPDPDIFVVTDEADNCTTNPTVAFVSDSSDGNTNPETITRTYSVTDQAGNQNTVNQKITINDTTKPTASNPEPINVQCSGDVSDPYIFVITDEADNCTSNPTVAFVADSNDGNTNPETITRTYSVTDQAGNQITVNQKITINDTTKPTASNPEPINVQCSGDVPDPDISVVTDEADNCTTNPTVAFVSDSSDGKSNPETITRTYSVTDQAGNTINVHQEIIVDDTTDPTASNPAPINVQCAADIPAADISVVTDETDNCTTNPTVAFVSDSNDGNSNPATITRTYSVTDQAGNQITVNQKITINDTTKPTASNPEPINVQCSGDVPDPDISVVTNATDNCTSIPIIAFVSHTSDGNFNPEIITRTYSVTDEAGNSIEVIQQITVRDTQDPELPDLPDLIGECPLTVTPPTTTDNCDGTVTATTGVSDLTFKESESIIWIFTDASGNSTGPVEQKIIINDTTAPETDGMLPPISITGCQISSIAELDIPIANDACEGEIHGTLGEDFQFPYSFYGTNSIQWQFIDSKGNVSFLEQEIELIEADISGGTLDGTFESTVYEEQIDITSCGEEISIDLNLTGQKGTIVQWEQRVVNEGGWEAIPNSNNQNTHTVNFASNALESTYYRVLIEVGTCKKYSESLYVRALPAGPTPSITNQDPDGKYCLGDEVNLKATIPELATPGDAIPDSEGDFRPGQLNTNDPDSWLIDGAMGGFSSGGNASQPRNWSGTNANGKKKHTFGDIQYDSQQGVFAVAQGNINSTTTLESPIMDLSNTVTATLDFDQAFYFTKNDEAVIEISINGGTTYSPLRVMHATGTGTKAWYTAGTAASVNTSSATFYNFSTDNTSISLEDYLGESNVRIRWSFTGTSNESIWALDSISVNRNVSVEVEIEWTEGIGNPDEEPLETGENEVPINFEPATPGIHQYGGTALINGCRTYDEDGTGLIDIYVSYSYAGEDIEFTSEECGQNTVQLNAYDNTISANDNASKGAYPAPPPGCKSCDNPGTGDIGEWTWSGDSPSCTEIIFSDVNDPNATFTAGPGTYTLTWTVDGCSNDITVKITDCKEVNFDGIDDYVDFGNNYDLNGAFSLEMWIKPESKNSIQTIFSKRDAGFTGTARGYDLSIKDGIVSFNWNESGSIVSPNAIDTNRWFHIALTHSSAGEYKLYIDGIPVKVEGGGSPSDNDFRAILGAMDSNEPVDSVNHFHGWIEELKIWNTALTKDQLHLMMNQRIKEVNTNEVEGEEIPIVVNNLKWDNLIGYYRMDNIGCGSLLPHEAIGFNGKLKNITSTQTRTAPLPYIATGGDWWATSSWKESDVWDPPNSTGVNDEKINWNIVRLDGNTVTNPATSDNSNSITLLGLLDNGGTLKMNGDNKTSGNELKVTHYLSLDGLIDLNGESQLVQTEGSILVGSGSIDKDQLGTASSYNYNYWSSPVMPDNATQRFTISGILKKGLNGSGEERDIQFGNGPFFVEQNNSNKILISNYWINGFFPNPQNPDEENANQYHSWKQLGSNPPNEDLKLFPGEGFTMKGTTDISVTDAENQGMYQTYFFNGFPNNGTLKLRKSYPNQNYLIGNPYPSAIDANEFIDHNEPYINGAIYYWHHFAGQSHYLVQYVGGYATYSKALGLPAKSVDSRIDNSNPNSSGGKRPGRYIPVAQGFFVNTSKNSDGPNSNPENGVIEFRNKMRVFAPDTDISGNSDETQFLKPETKTKKQAHFEKDTRYKIRLDFNSPQGYWRQIGVAADEATTPGIDYGYEALLIDEGHEDMYWMIDDDKYVIQAVPHFNLDQKLALGLTIAEEKEFNIKLGELENIPEDMNIFIRDNVDSTYHDLRSKEFTAILDPGQYRERYDLVFQEPISEDHDEEEDSGDNEEEEEEENEDNPGDDEDRGDDQSEEIDPDAVFELSYSHRNNEIVIKNPRLQMVKSGAVYNILGQKIQEFNDIPLERLIKLQVIDLPEGVYIMKLRLEEGNSAIKFIKE